MRRLRLKALALIMFFAGTWSLVMTVVAYGNHLTTPGGAAGWLWFTASLTAALFLVGTGTLLVIPLAGRRRTHRATTVPSSLMSTVSVVAPPVSSPAASIALSMSTRLQTQQATALHVVVFLVAIGGLSVVGFQTATLLMARGLLTANLVLLDGPVKDSEKMTRQLDGLAGGTAALAREGHPIARKIVEDLRNVGVNLNPPKPAP